VSVTAVNHKRLVRVPISERKFVSVGAPPDVDGQDAEADDHDQEDRDALLLNTSVLGIAPAVDDQLRAVREQIRPLPRGVRRAMIVVLLNFRD
jgi:hypothetical protein